MTKIIMILILILNNLANLYYAHTILIIPTLNKFTKKRLQIMKVTFRYVYLFPDR